MLIACLRNVVLDIPYAVAAPRHNRRRASARSLPRARRWNPVLCGVDGLAREVERHSKRSRTYPGKISRSDPPYRC
jgi:hypothetical protein